MAMKIESNGTVYYMNMHVDNESSDEKLACSPFLDKASYDTESIMDGALSFIYHQFV